MPLFDQLKSLLPGRSDNEINGVINDVRSSDPNAKDDDIVTAVSNLAPAMSNGSLDRMVSNDFVSSKYGLKQRKELEDQIAAENEGPNYAAGIAALGAGLSGRDSAAAGQNFINAKRQDQANRLAEFDKNAALEKSEILSKEENDPNSDASKMAQRLASEMGVDPAVASKLTAARFKQLSPVLERKYQVEQNKLARIDAAKARNENVQIAREDRLAREADRKAEREDKIAQAKSEKEFALTTPFGLANSVDDAKKLKDASEAKANFDNKLEQMIALREKHGGGNVTNREDVARGKQLAKDLLLEYKNMAKLGVLSQADEAIINAIIPEDPLEFNSPYAALTGQDPTLARLKSFKEDSDKDFRNRVATRIRGGATNQTGGTQPDQYAGQPSSGPKPGDVVKVRGKSYRVGPDGDSLEPLPQMAGQ